MLLVFLYLNSILFSQLRIRRVEQPVAPPVNTCAGCAYDLTGLPDDSLCPECGLLAGMPRQWRTRYEVQWVCVSLTVLLLTAIPLVVYLCIADPLARALVERSYRVLGYSETVAAIATSKREMVWSGTDWILMPLPILVVTAPIIARFWRWRAGLLVLGTGAALAAGIAVARWTVPALMPH